MKKLLKYLLIAISFVVLTSFLLLILEAIYTKYLFEPNHDIWGPGWGDILVPLFATLGGGLGAHYIGRRL
jgi:hypothetical protein